MGNLTMPNITCASLLGWLLFLRTRQAQVVLLERLSFQVMQAAIFLRPLQVWDVLLP